MALLSIDGHYALVGLGVLRWCPSVIWVSTRAVGHHGHGLRYGWTPNVPKRWGSHGTLDILLLMVSYNIFYIL